MTPPLRLAVVGGGWAGLAAAVEAVERGHRVTLFDTAPQPGGRARSTEVQGRWLDNGQHILIGAYADTLRLMRTVGADPDRLLMRSPLQLIGPDGGGLKLPAGAPVPAFIRGVLGHPRWRWRDRVALLLAASRWARRGFRCPRGTTVRGLTSRLPAAVLDELIDPLCVAALNTPADRADAQVFLRVLKDALFGGRGSADLLLPTVPLSRLLPEPATAWLRTRGADIRLRRRVLHLSRNESSCGWQVDGECFDGVVLACSASEAARLSEACAPDWSAAADAFAYEPIVTVYLRSDGTRLPFPMVALREGEDAPAQFTFDLGALGHAPGLFAFVVSAASTWAGRGLSACTQAVMRQARSAFPEGTWAENLAGVHATAEKRATFACVPGLKRPPTAVASHLVAAGDYVEGPYPATLEGAVRSGRAAIIALEAGLPRTARPAGDQRANGAASGSPTNTPCRGQATLFQ